jgi:RND family efflux transporter MFP subunit
MKSFPLFTFLIATTALIGCSRHAESSRSSTAPVTLPAAKVHVVSVRTENRPELIEVTGLIRPAQRATLAAKIMGTIDAMPITLGQPVHAGDLLVKISAGEIAARVAQAQSQLNSARRDLDRERELLKTGASTTDMVRGLEDRFAASQAMVHEAETMVGYTEVRAPFDGVIARKLANAGDLASPGFPLLEVEGIRDFQVEAGIPESVAATLQVGATLHVEVPAAQLSFDGSVAELASAGDASALTVLAKITVPAETKVRSGQFARVQVPGAPTLVTLVPTAAISSVGQMQRVFVAATDHRAILRLVRTGPVHAELTEITAGLDANDRIVADPPATLHEGQILEITP